MTCASSIANDPPENLANETRDSSVLPSVTTKSDKKFETVQTNSNVPQPPGTNQFPSGSSSSMVTSGTNSPTVGPTLSTGSSSQTTVTIQPPGGANSPAPGQTPSTGGSSQPSVTTQSPGGANSPAPGQTPSTGGSSQPSVTTQSPGGANSPAPGQTPSTGGSSQPSVTTQPPGGANSPAPGQTPSTGGSSQPSVTTQPPGGANSPAPGQTPSTGGSSQPSVTTQPPGGANSPAPGQTPSTGGSSQPSVTTQPPGGANSPAPGQTPSTGGSSQPSVTTQPPGGANSPAPGQTPSTGGSSQPSVTTQPPGGANSPAPGQTPSTGGSSQPSVTTQPPGGANSSTVTSTGPSDPCSSEPCKEPASCIKLHNSRFCLCLEGYYYNETESPSCVKGKTFPGEITMNPRETDGLEDKNSANYQNLYKEVVNFFAETFNKTDYGQTVILKVRCGMAKEHRGKWGSMEKNTSQAFTRLPLEATCQNGNWSPYVVYSCGDRTHNLFKVSKICITGLCFSSQNLCDYYGCVNNSGSGCQDGLGCTCKPGLDRLNPQVPFCVAAATSSESCSESCNAEGKEQCVKSNSGQMECVCLPGYQRASGNGNCEECPFGYSGVDCKDQFQLILTIVGTVGGALILILLISFIVTVRSKNKKKNVEEQKLIEDDFHNVRLRQTGFSNYGADNSIFPKVRTGVQNQTTNPYANQRSMPRPDY
ncbi:mucin-13-like [Apodemus sylvaticus]|uniref:mucin-13-like n=1 Tax=Apodemus sylvaticus TaxID=10129 RepID=UPI002243E609|nr:mucin-13-like [Apodemus sylvaticus]